MLPGQSTDPDHRRTDHRHRSTGLTDTGGFDPPGPANGAACRSGVRSSLLGAWRTLRSGGRGVKSCRRDRCHASRNGSDLRRHPGSA